MLTSDGGWVDIGVDRKTQPVGLARPVIGILTENDDLDLCDGTKIERAENLRSRRKHRPGPVLVPDELGQPLKGIGLANGSSFSFQEVSMRTSTAQLSSVLFFTPWRSVRSRGRMTRPPLAPALPS